MTTYARTQTGFDFCGDEPARHDTTVCRTPAEVEAHFNQLIAELRQCDNGVSGERLREITPTWRDDLIELERRGHAFHFTKIDSRYCIVHLVN